MSQQVDIVVTGARESSALVDRLSRRLSDGTPALRGLVDTLLEAQSERFAGRGQRWRKLSRQTLRIDEQQGRDKRPLVVTGRLMRSLTVRGAGDQLVEIRPGQLRFGTRVFYAKFQKHMRRNPVGLTRIQKQSVVAELRRLLIEDP